jgi:molybdenum cofactor synthesis domain-containing protein
VRVGLLTISDRSARGEREDRSGPALSAELQSKGWEVTQVAVVADEAALVSQRLQQWADSGTVDLILTTGSTGFSPRDVAPEATLAVVDRLAPGLAEAMRARGLQQTPHAMLSRAVAAIRGAVLIVNLPGNPKAAQESLQVILPALPHALELLQGAPGTEQGHLHRPPPSTI